MSDSGQRQTTTTTTTTMRERTTAQFQQLTEIHGQGGYTIHSSFLGREGMFSVQVTWLTRASEHPLAYCCPVGDKKTVCHFKTNNERLQKNSRPHLRRKHLRHQRVQLICITANKCCNMMVETVTGLDAQAILTKEVFI